MINSGFFDSKGGDRKYNSEDIAYLFSLLMTNGVYANPATSLQVVADTNMNILVSAGAGIICGRYAKNPTGFPLTLANAHGTYTRIDRIVLRMNLTDRLMQLIVITGTPALSPVAPPLVRVGTYYDLSLATISVAAGCTAITQAMITDTRGNTSICGYVTGAVNRIDTTGLFAQYAAEWDVMRAAVAQDSAAILAAFDQLTAVSTVNGIEPDSSKNIALGLMDIPYNYTTLFEGLVPNNTVTNLSGAISNYKRLIIYAIINSTTSTVTNFDVSMLTFSNTINYVAFSSTSNFYFYFLSQKTFKINAAVNMKIVGVS